MRPTTKPQVWVNLLLACVLFLALALRLYRIQGQSLWNDEGTSVALAARSLADITAGAANDIHPPLYYYLLHFWMQIVGNNELAVRSLSALLGTLLVLLTFALGHLLGGDATGLLAALFAALSPFQIYYSQEARMYALSAFLGAISMVALLRLLLAGCLQDTAKQRFWPFFGYVLSTILLLYSHYFAATLIVVQNLVFLWWWLSACRAFIDGTGKAVRLGPLLRWVTLQAIVGISYLPWLLLTARQLGVWPAISAPLGFTALLLDLLRVFSLGLSIDGNPSLALAGWAILLLLGMIASWFTSRRDELALQRLAYVAVLLYLLVPISLMYVLSLRRPMYNPKFLLLCTPPFYLFIAQGAMWLATATDGTRASQAPEPAAGNRKNILPLRKGLALLAIIVFVAGLSVRSLQAYYFDPHYARDDYRGIAQYIQAVGRDSDAILINAPGQTDTFTYYYHGALPLYPLPRQRPLDEAQTAADLQQMIQARGRVFAILWATDESDPQRFLEGWLDQHTYKAMDSWYGNVRLVVYAVPAEPTAQHITHPLSANLGNQVRLLGYNLPAQEVRPGDIVQLTLFWQAITPMSERYKVFTHILDAQGHLVGQRDAEPGGGAKITTIWKEDERVLDNYGLLVLPAVPPGDYAIEIGMYGLNDGQRLPVVEGEQKGGDRILLQPIRVVAAAAPPPLSVLDMKEQLRISVGDLTLLGYDLSKLGFEHQPDAPWHPGDVLHLTLFWQARRQPQSDVSLVLQLRDDKGAVRLEKRGQPTEGMYPCQQWHANEIVRDQHNLVLPPDLPAGRYQILLSAFKSVGDQPLAISIPVAHLLVR
jgi:hypothetical protein